MLPETDDAAIQADAYIDALLTGHSRLPMAVAGDASRGPLGGQVGVRDAILVLEKGLPRFHPSFLFEQWLADQLRRQSETGANGATSGRIVPIAVIRATRGPSGRIPDKKLLVGGALASGFSIAGAAMFAWRRSRN
ncbi:MAG: hypothetical protein ACR2H0_03045 [Candidatus Limnocylindrales bacterium]